MAKTYGNYINGEWTSSASGRLFPNHNPARTTEIVSEFQDSTGSDAAAATEAAERAFPAWAKLLPPKRAEFLRKAAEVLKRRRDEAAEILTKEEGKNIGEGRGEIDRSIGLLNFYAGMWHELGGETIPSFMDGRFLHTVRTPLGVVALISPWNFPSAIPVWKSAPALLCGNTVVLKPSPLAPQSAAIVAEVYAEAGLPPGVFNLVTGAGNELGEAVVSDKRVRAISFTGSRETGKSIMRKNADRLIRIALEMGGKNPMVIMPDADMQRAVEDTVVGAFWAAGHKCTATSRAIVLEKVYDEFVDKVVARSKSLRVGDGMDPKTEVCPVIDERQCKKILDYIALAKNEGARCLVGGERLSGGIYDHGCYISPAVFADFKPDSRFAQEEIFGPVLGVIKVKDLDEAIAAANRTEFGLASGICTRDLKAAMEFARRSDAGMIHVNSPTAGVELQAPFGGCKDSTSGSREMGKSALEFYSQTKTVYVDA
ncbi:MAG TPA: aldehyde dehydrogenase family protein [Planctomycetota bacterium]|nr:aldehyde dehydrogenase family protein [Planctomycetota bacterium]